MKSFTLSHKKSRTVGLGVATLALSVGLFVMVERADAACTPATSPGTVINGQTVDCTGPTAGQNDPNGWGTGAESGVTINVQQGASVSGTAGGIDINAGTVNNHGGGSVIEATATGGTAISAEGGGLTVANSAGGVIRSNNTGGRRHCRRRRRCLDEFGLDPGDRFNHRRNRAGGGCFRHGYQ